MKSVDLNYAQSNWFDLMERVEAGEAYLLTRDDVPVATLTPFSRRTFGLMKGPLEIGPEFFEPLPEEELAAWE